MEALRENLDAEVIKREHFQRAIENVHPSITRETVEAYRRIKAQLMQRSAIEATEKPVYG